MPHSISRKHSHKTWERRVLNLEPYIQFEQERISRSRVVFHSIRFNLDQDVLQQIQSAKEVGCRLDFSPKFLADLRYYALIDAQNHLRSELTFYTYFVQGGYPEALMRSVISSDGEVLHQIKSNCLEYPEFCRQITLAHHWLINQLLSQLHLKGLVKGKLLVRVLSWLTVVAIALLWIPLLIQINPWLLWVMLFAALLLQRVLQNLIWLRLPSLSRWIWRKLLSGLLSHKPLDQTIAKGILARLVP
ncbi:hypothetical protein [Allocoleopsis franciscana]|uniref:Uncharacterized protein n=1 Tax=Allocoleopsis franciscana PCC 7113 TaxID=1173027 RepID=K9WK05_9CYAN|nr:hypothetical protein [Allocoleopsis franciscana]AFZ19867.1 hypothetical protein Mic7113_4166 [Allocoleopsis franciscana PCC 7113]